jgi:hypothetical protein
VRHRNYCLVVSEDEMGNLLTSIVIVWFLGSSRIGCSGAGKIRVSFANHFGASTQWGRITRRESVYRGQWRPLQVS